MGNFEVYRAGGVPIKAWVKGVPFEVGARLQLERLSRLPFVPWPIVRPFIWIAALRMAKRLTRPLRKLKIWNLSKTGTPGAKTSYPTHCPGH